MRERPALWYVTRYLPRSWRISLLRALAWPEFEVSKLVAAPAARPSEPFRVARVPITPPALERDAEA